MKNERHAAHPIAQTAWKQGKGRERRIEDPGK